jgi:hypothetical protein
MSRWVGYALFGALLFVAPAARAEGLRRFAVIVGNDSGGRDTRPLLYAKADARKVHDILTRLGGVRGDDAQLLLDGSAQDLLSALSATERRAADARARGEKTALVLYYSGHAKDGALRLGETRLPLDSLRARLGGSPADVRIAILDSCRSGELTRTKGARRAPAFQIQAEGPRDAKGMVILTSSSSDEDSQESDLVGGSYFSHHLASGLLGGADKSGDGRVTLFEAYAYAYDRTVADTAETAAGAQHPTFSYDLAGNGDLVLTDVASRREGVYLPREAPGGIYYMVDRGGFVAAEIVKNADGDRRVALAPGKYRVKRRLADRLRVGELEVTSGQMITLDENRLRDAPFSDDPVKGGYHDVDVSSHWTLGVGGGFQAVFDAPTRESLFPPTGLVGIDLQLRNFFRRDWVWGIDFGGGGANGTVTLNGMTTVPFRFSELQLATSLIVEWPHQRLTPFVGGRLALLLMTRKFDEDAFPAQFFSTLSPGLVGGVHWRLSRSFGLVLRGRLHYLLYNVDENRSLGFWELATAVSYDF